MNVRWLFPLVLIAALAPVATSCTNAEATPAPPKLRVTAVATPGDTLAYTVSWTAPAVTSTTGPASNYDFVTSAAATNGSWTVVYGITPAGPAPASGSTTGLLFTLKLIAIPWDSATFTVTVTPRNAKGSGPPGTVTWRVLHGLRAPGPVLPPKVDSSATVTAMLVRPDTIRFTSLGQSRQACPFIKFANGVIAIAAAQIYAPLCDSVWVRVFSAAQRAVSVPQRLCADSGGGYCITTVGSLREWQAEFAIISTTGKTSGFATFRPDGWPIVMVATR